MTTILHIANFRDWKQAQKSKSYHCSSLNHEGFIHCSQPEQVVKTANKFFKQQQDLVLLFIDTKKVQAEIRYEFGEVNELFPHLYGSLNLDAVYQIIDFKPNQDGFFELPVEVGELIAN